MISGVSIGAASAAAVAGAKDGDIPASLAARWEALSIPTQPLLPRDQQFRLSAWGVPGRFRPRSDYFDRIHWTSLCDPAPYLDTLERLIDWRRLHDARLHRVCVTATNLATTLTPTHLRPIPAATMASADFLTRIPTPHDLSGTTAPVRISPGMPHTFTLKPVSLTAFRARFGLDDLGRLTPLQRRLSASYSSAQRCAFGVLQIRS